MPAYLPYTFGLASRPLGEALDVFQPDQPTHFGGVLLHLVFYKYFPEMQAFSYIDLQNQRGRLALTFA